MGLSPEETNHLRGKEQPGCPCQKAEKGMLGKQKPQLSTSFLKNLERQDGREERTWTWSQED